MPEVYEKKKKIEIKELINLESLFYAVQWNIIYILCLFVQVDVLAKICWNG